MFSLHRKVPNHHVIAPVMLHAALVYMKSDFVYVYTFGELSALFLETHFFSYHAFCFFAKVYRNVFIALQKSLASLRTEKKEGARRNLAETSSILVHNVSD